MSVSVNVGGKSAEDLGCFINIFSLTSFSQPSGHTRSAIIIAKSYSISNDGFNHFTIQKWIFQLM